jgi:hypothetical protein
LTPVRLFSAEELDEGEPQAAAAAAAAAAVGGDDNAAAAAAAAAHPTSYFQSGADWTLSLINLRNRLFPGCHSVPFSSIHDCALPTLAPEPEQPFTVQQFVRELTIVGYEPTGTPQPKQGEAVKSLDRYRKWEVGGSFDLTAALQKVADNNSLRKDEQ